MLKTTISIKSLNTLAKLLGFSRQTICQIGLHPERFYVDGELITETKVRPIHIATGALELIQRRILNRILCPLAPHPCSFGGIKGKSAYDNAKIHLGKRFVAKLDVRDFYPSIHHRWVQHFFQSHQDCSPPVASQLRRLLTIRQGLPQGACTSPALADQLMRRIDDRIVAAFGRLGITYTRFVDDMTFSADFSLRPVINVPIQVLRNYGLHVNPKKIGFFGPGELPVITGYACGNYVGIAPDYLKRVERELLIALDHGAGASSTAPPYCKESYWAMIQYIKRTNKWEALKLKKLFDSVNWSVMPLNLKRRRPELRILGA